MPNTKRAYSDEEKQQREQKIIEAAQVLLAEKGFYAISMDEVAKMAGLAKGTVYLYFKTKEELFLSVFDLQADTWFAAIKGSLEKSGDRMTPESVVRLLVDSVKDKPELTRLVALKEILLEHNVSFERAYEEKLWMQARLHELGQLIGEKLGLIPEQGMAFFMRMFVFMIGLEAVAHPSPISRRIYEIEPSLKAIDFASELNDLLMAVLQSWLD